LEYNPCSVSAYPPDENHIIGGSEARPHSLPWHVSIQYEERHICAGTLIDDRHILTSAHCFQQSLIDIPYSVVLGPHYLSNSTRRVTIDRFIFHSDYNSKTGEDDIGLIRLSERIQSFSNNIKPACLARSFKEPQKSKPLIVAGWRTVQNNTSPVTNTNELRQTILTITDECSDVYKKYNFQKQICAGTEDSRRDLCQGDNGSGLFEKQKYDVDRWILIGIVSYGCEYAPKGYPGVYIRISAYYDWIQNTIEQMNK
jgi:secreted trypsin-like serine protease